MSEHLPGKAVNRSGYLKHKFVSISDHLPGSWMIGKVSRTIDKIGQLLKAKIIGNISGVMEDSTNLLNAKKSKRWEEPVTF